MHLSQFNFNTRTWKKSLPQRKTGTRHNHVVYCALSPIYLLLPITFIFLFVALFTMLYATLRGTTFLHEFSSYSTLFILMYIYMYTTVHYRFFFFIYSLKSSLLRKHIELSYIKRREWIVYNFLVQGLLCGLD